MNSNSNSNSNSNTPPTTGVKQWLEQAGVIGTLAEQYAQALANVSYKQVSDLRSISRDTLKEITNNNLKHVDEIMDAKARYFSTAYITDHVALLQAILNSNITDCILRENRSTKPQTKLAQNVAKFETVGRETALQQAYAGMKKRKDMSTSNGASHAAYNHLVATHSPPGGGKSTFLDKMLQREAADLEGCSDAALSDVLKASVPLAVTYNSRTPYNSGKLDNVVEYSLCSRLLYSYFFTASSSLAYLQLFLEPYLHLLKTSIVIKCIRHDAGGKPILLGLDEIVSAFGKQNVGDKVSEIISEVGKALNMFGWDEFNAVVTTLDIVVVNVEKTQSSRPIEWVMLSRLTTNQAMGLFCEELQEDNHILLKLLIIACAGHGRSLEQLKFCWGKHQNLRSSLNLVQFLSLLRAQLSGFNMLSLTTSLVVCALANSKISLDGRPENTYDKTIREYIRDGYFINNLSGTESEVVPIISPLALLYFAQGDHSSSLGKKLAALLYKMLLINPGYWQDFEIFHAHWEAVARMVRPTGLASVSYWYTEKEEGPLNALAINVQLKSKGVVTIHQRAKAWPESLLTTTVDLRDAVFLFENNTNNPGFDIILFEDNIAVALECRFSLPLSTTKLKHDDIIAKYDKTVELLQPHYADLNITRTVLVVVAYRELEQDIFPLPQNIFVLDKDALQKLYSPTLLPILEAMFLELNDVPQFAASNGFEYA